MISDDAIEKSFSDAIEKSSSIKQDDRFLSRLTSKETSGANSSSRVFYYGETSVAIPFVWEAQPGTPKHPLSETSLPPLTPPPSYYSNSNTIKKRKSKFNLSSCILPRLGGSRKTHVSPSSSSSRSSSSSSSSSPWSLLYPSYTYSMRDKNQGSFSSSGSSTIVSSFLKHKGSKGVRGWYPFGKIKNAIVSYGAGVIYEGNCFVRN